MDPLDHVCGVCDGSVPVGATRILAHRDGLAVLQVACHTCGSQTLEFATDGHVAPVGAPVNAPVSADDVLDMHLFLADWRGSLAELL